MRIAKEAFNALKEHCCSSQEEVCGFCLGASGKISAVRRATNAAPREKRTFLCVVSPDDLLWFARERMQGRILAFYHSHPSIPAVPSAIDVAGLPFRDITYLIYSVSEDSLRAWRWDGGNLEEEEGTVG